MKLSLLGFCAILILSVTDNVTAATSFPVVKPDPQAVAAATKWLSLVDAGGYSESYNMFPPRIKRGEFEKSWVNALRERRSPLGRPMSRKLVKAQFSHTLVGTPDGNYEFLSYNTAFARKAQTIEIVTLTKESGYWQVSGYHFK